MNFIYFPHGGPNGELARVQGTTYDATYLAYYRRWPGCYAVFWQPTGTILAECRTEKRAGWLMEGLYLLYLHCQLSKRGATATLEDVEDQLAFYIQGWRNIYPDEQPTRERKRPARAGWQPTPYQVHDGKHPGGVWELGGYVRGNTGAVEVRKEYGWVIELTHLPSGYAYFPNTEGWDLATILADTMTAAIPAGVFGQIPPDATRLPAMHALIAARDAFLDSLHTGQAA